MKSIPVDQAALTLRAIEVVAAERDGRPQMTDDGRHVWLVRTLVQTAGAKPETVDVRVPASVQPVLGDMCPVEFVDLVAKPWNMDGRSGVSLSAVEVRALRAKNGAGKPEPVGASA